MKTKLFSYLLLGTGALLAVAAIAGPPVLPTLNPPAPSFYTCSATGSGAICRGQNVEMLDAEPTGIICGTPQNPIELLETSTSTLSATRYYDSAGNLTRRFRYTRMEGTITNPATGITAKLSGRTDLIDTLAVPGDLSTATTQQTGPAQISLPGHGVLLLDTGRIVFDPDGNAVSTSGHLALFNYFNGNTAEAARLCSALGSPGTP